MASSADIHNVSPIMEDLIAHGYEFSFAQLLRLARHHFAHTGDLHEVPWQDRVWVRPTLNLAFPAADVAQVERHRNDGSELLITTTFMGLYGPSSPLPTHYTEDLLDEASLDCSLSRGFLDLLHQRLYHLYFQCWSKYRFFIRVTEEKNPQDLKRLFCLAGIDDKNQRAMISGVESLLRYTGLFTQHPRSASGLQTLLKDALEIKTLKVEQCVLRRVPIPHDQQLRIGVLGTRLGENTVLGSEVADRMGKFRIHIGPLSREEFASLLPDTPKYEKLALLTRFYIEAPLDFDVMVTMAEGEARPIRVGDPDGQRLGYNSWCFSGDTLGETSAVFSIGRPPFGAATSDNRNHNVTVEETGPCTLVDHYQQELTRLRELAEGYANDHPQMAPLICGNPADTSVERLFQGVAFLNANLQQRLHDDVPEIIDSLAHAISPNYLHPIPAASIVVFSPKKNCTTSQWIPVGTELKSIPVDGTSCSFTTRYPVQVHPLAITSASLSQHYGKPAAILLHFELSTGTLSEWNPKSLRFFLAGESTTADNLYVALLQHVRRVIIEPTHGGAPLYLEPTHLKPIGFDDDEVLFHSGKNSVDSFQLAQEYYFMPDKYRFIDLFGWDKWVERGNGSEFSIQFELGGAPSGLHQVTSVDFALFATPVINIFQHKANPIVLNNRQTEYLIEPADLNTEHLDIYSIQEVTGVSKGASERVQLATGELGESQKISTETYQIEWKEEGISSKPTAYLSIAVPQVIVPRQLAEVHISLACTNGALPGRLMAGDICKETDTSPSFANFTNCRPIRYSNNSKCHSNRCWELCSFYSNNLSNLDAANLSKMFKLICAEYSNNNLDLCNSNCKIEGITVDESDKMVGNTMTRGCIITSKINSKHYISTGSSHRFGLFLDRLMVKVAPSSSFVETVIVDNQGSKLYEGSVTRGNKPSI